MLGMGWLLVLKDQHCVVGALSLVFKTDGKDSLNQANTYGRMLTYGLQKQVTYLALSIRYSEL